MVGYFSYISKVIAHSNPIPLHGLIFKEKDSVGKEAVEKVLNLMNECFGDDYAIIDKNGKVLLNVAKKEIERFDRQQRAFYDVIKGAVSSKDKITILISEDSELVLVGSADDKEIDISDVSRYGIGKGCNKFSVFAHEVREQQLLQCRGKVYEYLDAHNRGMIAEKEVSGYTRHEPNEPSSHLTKVVNNKDSNRHIVSGNIDTVYENSSSKIEISIEIKRNNIIENVIRKIK